MKALIQQPTVGNVPSHLITFRIENVEFGVDTAQVQQLKHLSSQEDETMEIVDFHDLISFGDKSSQYKSPKLLIVKMNEKRIGVRVESPDRIVESPEFTAKPLPVLIRHQPGANAYLGVGVQKSALIIIVDLNTLIKEYLDKTPPEAADISEEK
jgi:chemotaxis signal transduction protein